MSQSDLYGLRELESQTQGYIQSTVLVFNSSANSGHVPVQLSTGHGQRTHLDFV